MPLHWYKIFWQERQTSSRNPERRGERVCYILQQENNKIRVTAAQAIAQGISEEGGLFVPVELPHFSMDTVREMMEMSSCIDRAKTVLRTFLTDFSDEELNYCVRGCSPGR